VVGLCRLPATTGVIAYIAAILLILLFAYSLSWAPMIGLSAANAKMPSHVVPLLIPPDLRVIGFVAGGLHADLAPGVRHLPALSVTISACGP